MMCALGIGTASGIDEKKKSTGGGEKEKRRTIRKKALVCVSLSL